jgi:quercetin dioxygenase-like cupin family protein
MKPLFSRFAIAAFVLLVTASSGGLALAHDNPAGVPIDLPCAHDATVEVLGKTAPTGATGMAMVSARITIAPGGGFDAHTHPGTVMAWIDSGTFGFTLLDDMEMTITRAASAGTPAATETIAAGQEVLLNPGDSFIETGMVHEAWNRGDDPVIVIVSALIEEDQPLTICAD